MWGGRVTEAVSYGGGQEHLSILPSSSVGSEEEMLNPLEWKEDGRKCKQASRRLTAWQGRFD